ncbi:hypothetical protein Cni_G23389 [Canna indica]|uniref:non-specific serine/threonine protein kinase n=1 Tax=Canna indica TaxID=4628 RepID=A0AAQ3QKE8_9LILI|nr:hypothetical protein Cni_G23389 [Canna indica]
MHASMATTGASFFLFLLQVALVTVIGVHGDHNHGEFTSIDCGIASGENYTDAKTTIEYSSDSDYIVAGTNHNISSSLINSDSTISTQDKTLRSFPQGRRNCYALPVQKNQRYLIRASFLHGNYDGRSNISDTNPIRFDLYLGVNLWESLNISSASTAYNHEAIAVASDQITWVCLVNKGLGTPFISSLELRSLKSYMYPNATASVALVNYIRVNFGPNGNNIIRSPADPYDRLWYPFSYSSWTEVNTTSLVQIQASDLFEVPSAVLQTAVAPVNSTELRFMWSFPDGVSVRPQYYIFLHFAEIQSLASGQSREFSIYLNENLVSDSMSLSYLLASARYTLRPLFPDRYEFLLNATASSTLPPIINALEVYSVLQLTGDATDSADVDAIRAVKQLYKVDKNWVGDPCAPKEYTWDGLDCSYNDALRITYLDLSSIGLNGTIDVSFGKLKALKYLDLSYNNLTGPIPPVLAELPSLEFLNLTSNQLSGPIPYALLEKNQSGSLTLRIEGNPDLCTNGTSCMVKSTSTKKKIATPVIVILCIVSVIVLLLVMLVLWRMRKPQGISAKPHYEDGSMQIIEHHYDSIQLENRQFTYMQLKSITNNFQRVLGKGGFGTVYHGYLDGGTQVAVKMRSQSSSQGSKEFLSEAQHLTRVHHRNLVSMVGYCKDMEYQAVVFEYMSQGTLQDHLQGKMHNSGTLSWRQRLHIAVDAAQGLEYLHKMCQPPLIHRDVKTANILLSERLEAKIADFGLSKVFQSDGHSHISTAVVGTPGYLDPEYYIKFQLSEKSDVYSLGIVLLELITGRPPILQGQENAHIVQWVRQGLSKGNIEDIVDTRLQEYDVNSVWKCADVALKCTSQGAHQRPTMTDVVMQLKESLELENPGDRSENLTISSEDNLYTEATYISQSSAHTSNMSIGAGGPSAR